MPVPGEPYPRADDALLVVDVQDDFLPGGALAVSDGERVIPVLNRAIQRFVRNDRPVMASRDWHPANHCSFDQQGGPWPSHCVAGSPGARFAGALELPPGCAVISKGVAPDREAYSAFQDTGLESRLKALGVRRLVVGGLATDYCVLHSVLDALAAGFEVLVLAQGVRAVNAEPGDGRRALQRMRDAGALTVEN